MNIRAIAVLREMDVLNCLKDVSKDARDFQLEKQFEGIEEASSYLQKFPVDLVILDDDSGAVTPDGNVTSCSCTHTMVLLTRKLNRSANVAGRAVKTLQVPFRAEEFKSLLAEIKEEITAQRMGNENEPGHFFVRADFKLHKVVTSKITLVEGYDDYIKIHQEGAKVLVVRMTMRDIMQMLPEHGFVRIHRSYILPIHLIHGIRGKQVLCGGKLYPIGGSYLANLKEAIGH